MDLVMVESFAPLAAAASIGVGGWLVRNEYKPKLPVAVITTPTRDIIRWHQQLARTMRGWTYLMFLPGYRKGMKAKKLQHVEWMQLATITPAWETALGMPADHLEPWPLWKPEDGVREVVTPKPKVSVVIRPGGMGAEITRFQEAMGMMTASLAPTVTTRPPTGVWVGEHGSGPVLTFHTHPDAPDVSCFCPPPRRKMRDIEMVHKLVAQGMKVEKYPECYAGYGEALIKIRSMDGGLVATMLESTGEVVWSHPAAPAPPKRDPGEMRRV